MTSVKCSKRLNAIAGLVPEGSVIFDVGSDHGLLPCLLVAEGKCPKAYAGDNKTGPLERAKENISRYGLEGKVIPVLSDGLDEAPDDADTVIIAGMGGYTVLNILKKADLNRYDRFIIQANRDVPAVRSFLKDNFYDIIDEAVVYDGFYYEIIVFTTGQKRSMSDLEARYGPVLLERREETFLRCLRSRRAKLMKIRDIAGRKDLYEEIAELQRIIEGDRS